MPSLTRMVLSVLLTTIFAATAALAQAPPVSAVGPRHLVEPAASTDLFDRVWRLLAQPWRKNGCELDPDGRCLTAKNGCSVDPSGRCLATKNGCQVDPNGRCL